MPPSNNLPDIISKILVHLEETGHANMTLSGNGRATLNPVSFQCEECGYSEHPPLNEDWGLEWSLSTADLPAPDVGMWRYVFDNTGEVREFEIQLVRSLHKHTVNAIKAQSANNSICVGCKWVNPDQTEGEITSSGGWRKTCLEGRSGPHQKIILGQPQNFTTCKYYEFNGYRPSRLERVLKEDA